MPYGHKGARPPVDKHQSVKSNAFAYIRLLGGNWFEFFFYVSFRCPVPCSFGRWILIWVFFLCFFSMIGNVRIIFGLIHCTGDKPLIFESHDGPGNKTSNALTTYNPPTPPCHENSTNYWDNDKVTATGYMLIIPIIIDIHRLHGYIHALRDSTQFYSVHKIMGTFIRPTSY